jgi:hypothetical protein
MSYLFIQNLFQRENFVFFLKKFIKKNILLGFLGGFFGFFLGGFFIANTD